VILDSSSPIKAIQIDNNDAMDDSSISILFLSHALRQHAVVRNHNISFRALSKRTQDDSLVFDRNPWWKRLLATDDLPLSLWSLFLEKADTWKCDASHSHLDVLYFLLREKNTLLLQNVRRRRIRKRNDMAFRHEPILDACIVSMETLQYAIVPYSRQVHTSQLLVYLI
jgi:hypothetical protein